jgi:hypothetical protein
MARDWRDSMMESTTCPPDVLPSVELQHEFAERRYVEGPMEKALRFNPWEPQPKIAFKVICNP